MANIDVVALTRPISDSSPCGPDLIAEGDLNFENFLYSLGNDVPASYVEFLDLPADEAVSVRDELKALASLAEKYAQRTRDLRVLVGLAKLKIFDRNLDAFAGLLDAIAVLLSQQWDAVHPNGEGPDWSSRVGAIEFLEERGRVILPLQAVPLLQSGRLGPISYRTYALAFGKAKPRGKEAVHSAQALESDIKEFADLDDLRAARERIADVQRALASIQATWKERAGEAPTPSLPGLTTEVDAIRTAIDTLIVMKAGPVTEATQRPESVPVAGTDVATASVTREPLTIPAGAVASLTEAAEALAAIVLYFARSEPSSPALLLIRQSEQLIGKSFAEVMRILMPDQATQAMIRLGGEPGFVLPLERLSTLEATENGPDEVESQSLLPNLIKDHGPSTPRRVARTRDDALRLMQEVSNFFRFTEPSSPIPLLLDRAREFVQQDFLSLVRRFLPEPPPKSGGSR